MKISPALGSLRDVMREYPPSGKVAMETQYHIYIHMYIYMYGYCKLYTFVSMIHDTNYHSSDVPVTSQREVILIRLSIYV